MSMIRIYKNAKVITETGILSDALVICENGRISEITRRTDAKADEETDCGGLFLSPGFADIHVHGGGGFSAMGTESDVIAMCRAHAERGTTSILPTTLAAPIKQLQGIEALLGYSKNVRMIGAAPEIPNAFRVGEEAAKRNIVASVAHTDAPFETVEEAFGHGFSDITHIWSACSAMHKEGIFRKVGAVEAALADFRCTAQFIGDLRHLPAGAIKLLFAVKGADKAYAITDGLEYSACDMKEGAVITQENGLKVLYEDGVMKLADRSCLAGSVAAMAGIVKNLVKTVGIPLCDAVKMSSHTPLSVVGFGEKKGLIKRGYDEDIILFDSDINVRYVCVGGKTVKPLKKS